MKKLIPYSYTFYFVVTSTKAITNNKNPHALKEGISDIKSKNSLILKGYVGLAENIPYYLKENKKKCKRLDKRMGVGKNRKRDKNHRVGSQNRGKAEKTPNW